MQTQFVARLLCLVALLCAPEMIYAQGTAFMYQGRLNDGANPANGNYDLKFALFDAAISGNSIGPAVTNSAVPVASGLFTTDIDFGPVFTGTNYWMAIEVRTNGVTNTFTMLYPREPLLPVPYAIFANSASNLLGTLTATQLVGTLPPSAFAGYTNTVSLTNSANLFSGTISGNGLNLTNLNGSSIAVGTVADARLSPNVALLNANQTFTGVNSFTNWGNRFTGNFFGNGLVGWNVETATSVAATIDAGFILTSASLTLVMLPTPLHIGDIVRISGAGAGGWQISQTSGQSIIGNFLGYGNSSWVPSDAPTLQWNTLAASADGSRMAAAADGSAQIYLSTDSGQNWSSSSSISSSWHSVAMSADGTHLIAGQKTSGYIYYSTNSGSTWTGSTGAGAGSWYSLAMSAGGSNAVAASDGGEVYISSNGGQTWQASLGTASWTGVASSADGTHLVAVGGGLVYTYTTSGGWVGHTLSGTPNLSVVTSSADGTKLAAAVTGGGIYTSSDSGNSWSQTTAPSANWQSIASSSDGGKIMAVANGGGIYTSVNFGKSWFQQANASTRAWTAVCCAADGSKVAAAVNNAGIYYSAVGTQTATTTGVNGYISGAQGSAVELQYIGNNQWMPVSSTGTIWAN